MKTIITALAAVSTLAMAAPLAAQTSAQTSAQTNVNAGGSVGIANRIAKLDTRIQAGVDAGTIDRTEARSLRTQLRTISRLERQYSRNGLTQQERSDLQQRLRGFRDQLAEADGRYGGYAQNEDGYTGQGGPYEEVECATAPNSRGVSSIFDSIFGGSGNAAAAECAGLQVGQRASGNLTVLPSQYRSQFRDGNGILYRTDGNQIYQIDSRSNTVLRVYAMTR